jgi:hypothetical protein
VVIRLQITTPAWSNSQKPYDPKSAFFTTAIKFVTAKDDKNEPPQKLALAFSTADVVVLGWRLGHLADKLQENNLAAVRILPERYAEAVGHGAFVAAITITPIAKAAAGKG